MRAAKGVTWLRRETILDRRTWVMYLIINDLKGKWGELVRIAPDEGFYKLVSKHVDAYVKDRVMPPDDIASAILNVADDVMSGRDVTLRAGDYIALQNHLRMSK